MNLVALNGAFGHSWAQIRPTSNQSHSKALWCSQQLNITIKLNWVFNSRSSSYTGLPAICARVLNRIKSFFFQSWKACQIIKIFSGGHEWRNQLFIQATVSRLVFIWCRLECIHQRRCTYQISTIKLSIKTDQKSGKSKKMSVVATLVVVAATLQNWFSR